MRPLAIDGAGVIAMEFAMRGVRGMGRNFWKRAERRRPWTSDPFSLGVLKTPKKKKTFPRAPFWVKNIYDKKGGRFSGFFKEVVFLFKFS